MRKAGPGDFIVNGKLSSITTLHHAGGHMSYRARLQVPGGRLKIGKAWLLLAFLVALLPDVRLEAGAWTNKAAVNPTRVGAGAAVDNGKIYLTGGMGDAYATTDYNYAYDPTTDSWQKKQAMPTAREFLPAVVVCGIIYAIGGAMGGLNPVALSVVEAYDPVTDTWTRKADLPKPRLGLHVCVLDGILYVFGGMYRQDSLVAESFAYDPASDTWTSRKSRPMTGSCAVTVYNGLIYTFGGGESTSKPANSAVYAYDPKTDSWAKKKDMPTPRTGMESSLVGGKIYVMGGTTNWTSGGQKNWEYNPSLDVAGARVWTLKENLPFGRVGACASEVNNKIYMIGGLTSGAPNYTNNPANQVYDPATDTWQTKKNMPTARAFLATAVVRGVIYAMGGGYPSYLDTVEAYDLATDTWTTKADLPKPCMGSRAAAVDGIIYLIGGNLSDSLCYAYDPSVNTWTVKTPRPQGGPCGVLAYRGLIYTFGGGGYVEPVSPAVFVYDPKTDQWTRKTDMPTARNGLRPYIVGGKIFVIGGFQVQNGSLATVEVYDPLTDRWTRKQNMPNSYCFPEGDEVDGKIYVMAGTPDWNTGGESNWEYNPALDIEAGSNVQESTVPTTFALEQNYPNPFNPTTVISYQLSVASDVKLVIFDLLGREVSVLVNEKKEAGVHSVKLDGTGLSSGAYFYRIHAGNFMQTKKLLLVR